MRNIIFIGHANPEDNEFTLWLTAKLRNEGYNVECDLTFLQGGESDYWMNLQDILDNKTCKYLLVLSKHTFIKQGVIDEWEQVKSISKRNGIQDFVMILKIDDVPFDIRIGVNVKNHFRFDESWARAFKQLVKKLEKDGIKKNHNNPCTLDDWLKNQYTTATGLVKRKEMYFSNWLPIDEPPAEYSIYEYINGTQAEAILLEIDSYPAFTHERFLITFLSEVPIFSKVNNLEIAPLKKKTVDINTISKSNNQKEFPLYADRKRFYVRLLNVAFEKHLKFRGLDIYEMSQKTKCFFHRDNHIEKNKVTFIYENSKTWKLLVGDYYESRWHYGISFRTLLFPQICYSLNSHIVFSDDGVNLWENKTKLHRARRAKGKSFFNEEWRMLLLAFLHSISSNNSIEIKLTEEKNLKLPTQTIQFYSLFGYDDPEKDARLVPLDYYEEDEEDYDDEDETTIDGQSN